MTICHVFHILWFHWNNETKIGWFQNFFMFRLIWIFLISFTTQQILFIQISRIHKWTKLFSVFLFSIACLQSRSNTKYEIYSKYRSSNLTGDYWWHYVKKWEKNISSICNYLRFAKSLKMGTSCNDFRYLLWWDEDVLCFTWQTVKYKLFPLYCRRFQMGLHDFQLLKVSW